MFSSAYTLPRDVNTGNVAIPFSVSTSVTTVDTELGELNVTNTTGATITLTLTDGAGTPVTFESAINCDPNSPIILQWNPPLQCASGIKWQASATGLIGQLIGRRLTGWSGPIATDTHA